MQRGVSDAASVPQREQWHGPMALRREQAELVTAGGVLQQRKKRESTGNHISTQHRIVRTASGKRNRQCGTHHLRVKIGEDQKERERYQSQQARALQTIT
jgi:hypothetical protein